MFQEVDSYLINDRFALKIALKKRINDWAVRRYYSNFLFDLGKIDPSDITYAKIHNKIGF